MANPKTRHCPHCDAELAGKVRIYGQYSYFCDDCYQWGPWKDVVLKTAVQGQSDDEPN